MSSAETIANLVLDRLDISRVDDLLLLKEIVYARGAILREHPLEGAEACLLVGPGRPIITVSSSPLISHHRRRFSIAHELGHLEMHRGTGLLINCTKGDIQDMPNHTGVDTEQEANQFASAFLLPARFVEKPFVENEPSFDIISEWAMRLDTSLTATSFRFTRFTPEPVAVVYSVRGNIQYFQPSEGFAELGVFPDVKNPVGSNTDARRLFNGMDIKGEWREVRALEWFRDNRDAFDKTDVIREWSIHMPSYEAVLSLLWVHKPLGEIDDW